MFFSFQDSNTLPSNKSKNARHFRPQMANDYSYSTDYQYGDGERHGSHPHVCPYWPNEMHDPVKFPLCQILAN